MTTPAPAMRPGEQEAIEAVVRSPAARGTLTDVVAGIYPVIAAAVREATLEEAEQAARNVYTGREREPGYSGALIRAAAGDAADAVRALRDVPEQETA